MKELVFIVIEKEFLEATKAMSVEEWVEDLNKRMKEEQNGRKIQRQESSINKT